MVAVELSLREVAGPCLMRRQSARVDPRDGYSGTQDSQDKAQEWARLPNVLFS